MYFTYQVPNMRRIDYKGEWGVGSGEWGIGHGAQEAKGKGENKDPSFSL
jgi:hypothetical protein